MDRSQWEQRWSHNPVRSIPSDAPKPWYVAGYSFRAVDNVLRIDYFAKRLRTQRTVYAVPGGEITYIGNAEELRGFPHGVGTLFVLWPVGISGSGELDRILDEAKVRVGSQRTLHSGPVE